LRSFQTHTLSSVALLPDFEAIENLKIDNSQAGSREYNDSDEEEDNSFFEQKSQRNSSRSGTSRNSSYRDSRREEKAVDDDYDDFGTNDATLFK
jgi:hypothetical protein